MEEAQDATRDIHDSDDEDDSGAELSRIRRTRENCRRSKIQRLNELMGDENMRQQRAELEEERKLTSAAWGVLHSQSALKQILSPWSPSLLSLQHYRCCA